jgi:tetratricopeptide (TPR) repeat protein
MSFWSKIFGKNDSASRSQATRLSGPATATPETSRPLKRGSPITVCPACRRQASALVTICPTRGSTETLPATGPEWFEALQAHVIAVQCNDTAVRLFREGRLDDAIAELGRGLEVSPQYATGYSNLGFLHLRKGQFDQAVACLLRALAVDPHHQDAPDHLFDVLSALIDELVRIGCGDGFLSTQPGGKFDDDNRHMCARAIGALIAKIGQQGIFKAGSRPLASDLFMEIVISNVAQKMADPRHAVSLKSAWSDIGGWYR